MKFYVVIRGRNCSKYIKKCIRSIQKQKVEWEAFVFLDKPKDNSLKVVRELMVDQRIHCHVNHEQLGLSQNLYYAIRFTASCLHPDDEDIFAIVDADDMVSKSAFGKVLERFRKHSNLLITTGSYIKLSKGRKTKISKPYPDGANVRKYPWRASHLKCIKWKLLKHIKPSWFQYKKKWLPAASDVALMLPLLELAGLENYRHIPEITYYWRDDTKYKTRRKLQIKCEKIIRKKKPLKQL